MVDHALVKIWILVVPYKLTLVLWRFFQAYKVDLYIEIYGNYLKPYTYV